MGRRRVTVTTCVVWIPLLCLIVGVNGWSGRRTTVSEMLEISLNKSVRVTPYNATCGHHENATILHKSRTIECVSHCRPRQHPRSLKVDRLITTPGLSFGGSPCKVLEVDFGKHQNDTNIKRGNHICHLQFNKYIQYEEETYVMQVKTFENISQIKGSLLNTGSWRVDILGSRLAVYRIGKGEVWSMDINSSSFKFSQLAFQVSHGLGRLSMFLNGKFYPPEIEIKESVQQQIEELGRISIGSTQNKGFPWLEVESFSRYQGVLTNREIESIYTSKFPQVFPSSQCLCPSHAPAISDKDPLYCQDNSHTKQFPRLPTGFFPADFLTDGNNDTHWVSLPGHSSPISLEVDLESSVVVAAVHLLSSSPSAAGFTVSLFRDHQWMDIKHVATDCLGHLTTSKTVSMCTAMESIIVHRKETVEYQIDLLDGQDGQPEWTDGESVTEIPQRHLSGSKLRLTVHGMSQSHKELPGLEHYHAFGELRVFAQQPSDSVQSETPRARSKRATSVTACSDCYSGGTLSCDSNALECLCREDAGIPAKGGNTCSPYIEDGGCIPDFGPVAGGTSLFITGGYLGRVEAVSLGDTDINMTILHDGKYSERSRESFRSRWGVGLSDDTFIHCLTPELNTSKYPDVFDVPLPLTIHLVDGTVFTTSEKTWFRYRPNPVIESITPGETFARGGFDQTISGKYLDSVYASHMTIYADYGGLRVNGTDPFYWQYNLCAPCTCTVKNNGTKMVCPTPQFILDALPGDLPDTQKINDEQKAHQTKYFYAEFEMDGVQLYKGPADNRYIRMYKDPIVHPLDGENPDSVQVFRTYGDEKDTFLEIAGEGLLTDCACQKDYYTVKIGNGTCEIKSIVNNHITCKPPETEPEIGDHSKDGNPLVVVTIGNNRLSYHLGYLDYRDNLTEEPGFRTAIIAGCIALVVLIAIIIAVIFIRKRMTKELGVPSSQDVLLRPHNIYERGDREVYRNLFRSLHEELRLEVESCLLTPESLELGAEVGKGQFGTVYRGTVVLQESRERVTVAVKTVKDGERAYHNDLVEFLEEATKMHGFIHENVLELMGVVIDQNIPYIIMPFMDNGSLKSYVSNPNNRFSVKDLLNQSHQVSKGMAYLSDQHCIHRDLAARNCMVDKDMVVKVADFGLARDAYEKDYYSAKTKNRYLPVKWMAIECLETARFTTKSDVWSFGVLMWELFTRCTTPYPDVDSFDLKRYLLKGRRLDCPPTCPKEIYNIMLKCWIANPEARPPFQELTRTLKGILGEDGQPARSRSIMRRNRGPRDYINLEVTNVPGYLTLGSDVRNNNGEAGYANPVAGTYLDGYSAAGATAYSKGQGGYDNQRTSQPTNYGP